MKPRTRPIARRLPRHFWRALIAACAIPVAPLTLIIHANLAPIEASQHHIFTQPKDVPPNLVGLVFGTSDRTNGRENLYFRHRINATAALWKSGKLRAIIVSGDNRSRFYNEPEKMRQALVARGVPANLIFPDYAGLRTLDSVVRAKEVFGLHSVVFISQRFQIERAIYIAQARGLNAYGFIAQDVTDSSGLKTKIREVGARVKMWLDVHWLNTQPQRLGEKISLPDASGS